MKTNIHKTIKRSNVLSLTDKITQNKLSAQKV